MVVVRPKYVVSILSYWTNEKGLEKKSGRIEKAGRIKIYTGIVQCSGYFECFFFSNQLVTSDLYMTCTPVIYNLNSEEITSLTKMNACLILC